MSSRAPLLAMLVVLAAAAAAQTPAPASPPAPTPCTAAEHASSTSGSARDVQFAGMAAPGTVRMTFFNEGPGRVRQLGEQSMDGGRTWTTMYDPTYTRRK